jgi:hypothetical protein
MSWAFMEIFIYRKPLEPYICSPRSVKLGSTTHLEGLELFLGSSAPPPPASIWNIGVYTIVQALPAQICTPKFRCR